MSWSVVFWLSVMLTLMTLTVSDHHRRRSSLDMGDVVDRGVLERFLLQRARVEAVKRGILQQLGLTEAPRPPQAHNRSSPGIVDDDAEGRSVMAAYRRTVAQTRRRVVSNDVTDDVTGNDVTNNDAPSARQFYSFKGHAAAGSGCESGEPTLLFRVDIPEPTSPGIETIVTSATLKLFTRRRRRSHRPAKSPTDDIIVVTVYQLDDQRRHHAGSNGTEVTSRAVRVPDDETGATAWEEFDVTSAVKRHVTQLGGGASKVAGLLRLRVRVTGATDSGRRHLVFGEDWCDDVISRELRHRHHPVLNVFTRDRAIRPRRTRRSVLPDVSVSSSVDEPLCTAGDDETRCCRRPLWISFREIGWDDWILAPEGYQAYYCYGACPPGHRTAHNHAAIRELLSTAGGGGDDGLPIPRPACTATRLGSLALAHYLNGRRVVSIFNDMIVEECRCA